MLTDGFGRCRAMFFGNVDFYLLSGVGRGRFRHLEIQDGAEGKVKANGEHQGVGAGIAFVAFGYVIHGRKFWWLIEIIVLNVKKNKM